MVNEKHFKITVKEKNKEENIPFASDEDLKEKKLDLQEDRKTEIKKMILENRESLKKMMES